MSIGTNAPFNAAAMVTGASAITSTALALPATTAAVDTALITNSTSSAAQVCWFQFWTVAPGGAAPTGTVGVGIPLFQNASRVVPFSPFYNYVTCITSVGTGIVAVELGTGSAH